MLITDPIAPSEMINLKSRALARIHALARLISHNRARVRARVRIKGHPLSPEGVKKFKPAEIGRARFPPSLMGQGLPGRWLTRRFALPIPSHLPRGERGWGLGASTLTNFTEV